MLIVALLVVSCAPPATTAPTTAPATQPTTALAATSAPTSAATRAATTAGTMAATTAATAAATSSTSGAKGPSQALIDAAKAEGQLNVIALDPTWLNYRLAIDTFK
ncbi:MAG: hypothetical protein LC737_05385, partial [Chloroflexi bacterium]|nr:hypothetical protein [Chloroflexota bacterium]